MRKHGGTPSRRDKHVTLAAISPPGVARGRFFGGQQSGLAGSKPPPLFTREASSCSSQGRRQGEPWGASPRPSAPTYLPTWQALGCSLTPGLRISFGRVTCMARAASVPGLWTLGFLLLRGACLLVWVVVEFGFRLCPATPGWGVGVCMCLCACSACDPPLLAGVCGVGVCAWARVSAAPRHSLLGCRGLCLLVCALCLHPATPGWGVRLGCVCLGLGYGCTLPLLAGVLGCVCACVRALLVPRHSWLGCAACVLFLASGLGCAPPLLAGVSGFVCACVRAPFAPRHSWVACAVWVCVLGSGFGCAPPLLAGLLGCVCACLHAPLLPRHSWLGCAAWVCVLGLGFRLCLATPGPVVGVCLCLCARSACTPPLLGGVCGVGSGAWAGLRLHPATPGSGDGVWVCLCARSACTPPLLAGVCGVGVCAWARVSAAPRHSWLGCWVCLCLWARSACTPPLLALVCDVGACAWAGVSAAPRHSWLGCLGVCVFVGASCLYPATPGWGVRCGCVCSGSGFSCATPLLAGVLGCVCVCACGPLVPRHSWLRCAVWVCVLQLGLRLRPASPCWGFGLCVCLCACFACTLLLLAGVCGVGVCAWARVLAAPRPSRPGCAA